MQPKASDLLIATFDASVAYLERGGRVVRGQRPDWLDAPMVRGDEFGPPIRRHAELANASQGRRR